MLITRAWAEGHDACDDGLEWLDEHFPGGGEAGDVLETLLSEGEFGYLRWLYERLLWELPPEYAAAIAMQAAKSVAGLWPDEIKALVAGVGLERVDKIRVKLGQWQNAHAKAGRVRTTAYKAVFALALLSNILARQRRSKFTIETYYLTERAVYYACAAHNGPEYPEYPEWRECFEWRKYIWSLADALAANCLRPRRMWPWPRLPRRGGSTKGDW